MFKIFRKRCICFNILLCHRMMKAKYFGMKCLALEMKGTFCSAIYLISQNRMTYMSHVNSDLVGSPRFQNAFHISIFLKAF